MATHSITSRHTKQDDDSPPPAIEPFAAAPFMTIVATINSWWLTLMFPLLGGFILLACILEGSLGEPSDFQLWSDLTRIFSPDVQSRSDPSFPLIRDIASWFFLFVACATCVLVHRQWQLIRECIPGVVRSGAVQELDAPRYNLLHRLILLPRALDRSSERRPLAALIESVNCGITKAGQLSALTGFAAVLLTVLVIIGENQNGLFRVVAPTGSSGTSHEIWLAEAYSSWWASIEHPFGLITYGAMASIGIFVILEQNIVGAFCVYIILCFPAVADLDADWLNRDGGFGWTPVARVFRTTVWSLALHGSALSVILVTLGVENFPWVIGLAAIWIIVCPLYLFVPRLVFGRVQRKARIRRVEQIYEQMNQANISQADVLASQPFREEIERVNATRVNPLRVRRIELPAFVVLFILPVLLTAVQVFFSVTFGN